MAAFGKMLAAFDVHYFNNGSVRAAAVLFAQYGVAEAETVHTVEGSNVAGYIPGSFYRSSKI